MEQSFNLNDLSKTIELIADSDIEVRREAVRKLSSIAMRAVETETDSKMFASLIWPINSSIEDSSIVDRLALTHGTIINKLKAERETIRLEQQRFKNYLDAAGVGTWEWQVENGQEIFDERCAAIAGYSPEDLEQNSDKTWNNLTHPEDFKKSEELLRDCIDNKTDTYDCELRTKHKDGHWIWNRDIGKVFERDKEGKATLMLGISIDINERKIAEQALIESEERYRIITEQSPLAIELYDKSGQLVNVNPACLELFGVQNVDEIKEFSLFDDPNISEDNKDKLKQGCSIRYEALFDYDLVKQHNLYKTTKSGQHWLDVSISTINGSVESIDGYLLQISDITERKNYENSIIEKTALLEALVETSHDGILVIGEGAERLIYNNRIIDLFNVPPDVIRERDDAKLLKHVTSLAANPTEFIKRVNHLYDHPEETSFDEIKFTNGMFLERYSAPIKDKDGKYYGRIWSFHDITERKQLEKELIELSLRDPLTKLPNKIVLKNELESLLSQKEITYKSAFVMFDIVKFADINKIFDHATGDKTLLEFSNSLSDSFRKKVEDTNNEESRDSDVVSSLSDRKNGSISLRFGGDEFAAIFKGIDNAELDLKALLTEKSKKLLLGMKNFMIKEKMSEFGVYANIIWIDSSLYATYDELIAAAEPKQKRGFPNRVEITIQVDDKGNHYLFDNIRREYIFE